MTRYSTKTALMVAAILAVPGMSATASVPSPGRSVSLTQDPVVMRLSKDEFRIAFGIAASHCAANGCSGVIRYRVDWKTEEGRMRSEVRRVNYAVEPSVDRSVAVDRQYFDTAEGAHTTDIVRVSVDTITCVDGADAPQSRTASAMVTRP